MARKRRRSRPSPSQGATAAPIDDLDDGGAVGSDDGAVVDDDVDDYDELDDDDDGDGVTRIRLSGIDRVGALSGLAFSILSFVGLLLMAPGRRVDPDDPAPQIAERLEDQVGVVFGGVLLTLLAIFFLMVFVAYAYRRMQAEAPDAGWLTALPLVGGILFAAMLLALVMVNAARIVLDDYGTDVVVAKTLLIIGWNAVIVAFTPAAVFVGGLAVSARYTDLLPRWLTRLGLGVAIGLLLFMTAQLAFVLASVWIGTVSVLLARGRSYG